MGAKIQWFWPVDYRDTVQDTRRTCATSVCTWSVRLWNSRNLWHRRSVSTSRSPSIQVMYRYGFLDFDPSFLFAHAWDTHLAFCIIQVLNCIFIIMLFQFYTYLASWRNVYFVSTLFNFYILIIGGLSSPSELRVSTVQNKLPRSRFAARSQTSLHWRPNKCNKQTNNWLNKTKSRINYHQTTILKWNGVLFKFDSMSLPIGYSQIYS